MLPLFVDKDLRSFFWLGWHGNVWEISGVWRPLLFDLIDFVEVFDALEAVDAADADLFDTLDWLDALLDLVRERFEALETVD